MIFNTYMLIWSLFVNKAVFGVFFTLEVTEILLVIGNFGIPAPQSSRPAAIVGVVTAAVAWYASAAGVHQRASPVVTYCSSGKPLSPLPGE